MNGLKEVFFLGAGASADAGAPLSRSFLDDDYLDKHLKIKTALSHKNYERFQKIRRIAKQIFPYSTRDIESLLNGRSSALFLDLIKVGEIEKIWDIESSLDEEIEWYIMQIIFLSLRSEIINKEAVSRYEALFNKLEHGDSIITLNYDLIVDHSLLRRRGELNYSIDSTKILFPKENFEVNSGILIYKLHGSMNWLICKNDKCKKISIYLEKMAQYAEDPNADTNLKCKECSCNLQRIIVPPRWDKEQSYSDILNSIWIKASQTLHEANVVNVIGYSLPESDIYARYLLASALKQNPFLDINIINSNQKIQDKYREFLSDSNIDKLDQRYQQFLCTFKKYIEAMKY